MKNPSSTQPLGTGQESKSCGCTSDVSTGMDAIVPANPDITPQRTAEQPAAGNTGPGIGNGKLGGA